VQQQCKVEGVEFQGVDAWRSLRDVLGEVLKSSRDGSRDRKQASSAHRSAAAS
jgi:hypothetical protein